MEDFIEKISICAGYFLFFIVGIMLLILPFFLVYISKDYTWFLSLIITLPSFILYYHAILHDK